MTEETAAWWDDDVLDRDRWGAMVEPALERLAAAMERKRLPRSLLLIGPQGLGRELAAVEAAAMLVCAGAARAWSDAPCAGRVRAGVHPDVELVRPTGKKRIIKIEQVRAVVESARSRPYEGEHRVWIFDGAEASHFGASAANAFLKTLEEPPDHAVFVLLADNPTAVLPTILSRCQQLMLPGAVAIARRLASDIRLPELARESLEGDTFSGAIEVIRSALESGRRGETRELVRLAHALPDTVPPFAAVAAVALEMAASSEEEPGGEELALLAAELLQVERRSRSLNLNTQAQMASCLLRWYREL